MKIYMESVENGIPAIFDKYIGNKLIEVPVWVIMEEVE